MLIKVKALGTTDYFDSVEDVCTYYNIPECDSIYSLNDALRSAESEIGYPVTVEEVQ